MIFSYNIPVISIVLFSLALLGLLYIIFIYSHRIRLVRRRRDLCDSQADDEVSELPKTSVVVCTRNDADQLSKTLPLILQQEFPVPFEVIVVNDGTPDDTDMVVTRLKAEYPNLYLTFVPDVTRNISRKKLAIQLGVKAAKGDAVVVTDASARVGSDHWLLEMVKPFADPTVEVVLGYNYLNMPEEGFFGRLVTAFDCAADAVTWLSAAISRRPYRGCASNIAYRRDLYFRNNGFHSSFNLRYGDDDLFVNEIATPDNTVVQLSASSIGVHGNESGARKRYKRHRLSHAFTGRTLPKTSRRIMAVGEWLMWLVPICSVCAAMLAGITNIFGWVLAAVLIIGMYIWVAVMWRKAVASLGGPNILLSAPFIAACRPLRNIRTNIAARSRKNSWYVWQ